MPQLRFILCLAALIAGGSALAEERIALVVGNGAYVSVAQLDNPVPDAILIASRLEALGFQVTFLRDTTQIDLKRGVAQFGRRLREAGPKATGLFYYAGHGVQSFGTNFLLPVDTRLSNAADLGLVAVEAETILRQMASARNKTNIFILDACRDNPFQTILDLDDNGLAEMKAPTGTFLAYATAPGAVALDGEGGNSPFTAALAQEMGNMGAPIEQIFRQVRVRVLEKTQGVQTPWDTSSLTGEFFFAAAKALSEEELAEKQLWDAVRATRDPVQIMLFLRAYGGGRFEPQARALMTDVMAEELKTTPAPGMEAAARSEPSTMTPGAAEKELIAKAQKTGAIEYYEAYVAQFPDGVFAELARTEISAQHAKMAAAAPLPTAPELKPAPARAAESETLAPSNVTYERPLTVGTREIIGRTLAELIQGSPLFPPIEGIPEKLWKGESCSNCHQWNRDRLCTQAESYLGQNAPRSLAKQHPYGGTFKQNLKSWAAGGCK